MSEASEASFQDGHGHKEEEEEYHPYSTTFFNKLDDEEDPYRKFREPLMNGTKEWSTPPTEGVIPCATSQSDASHHLSRSVGTRTHANGQASECRLNMEPTVLTMRPSDHTAGVVTSSSGVTGTSPTGGELGSRPCKGKPFLTDPVGEQSIARPAARYRRLRSSVSRRPQTRRSSEKQQPPGLTAPRRYEPSHEGNATRSKGRRDICGSMSGMSIPSANSGFGTSALPTTSGLGHVLGSTGGATICSGATASSSPPLTMTGKSNALSTTTIRKKRVRAKRLKAAETQKITLRGSGAMVGMCQPGCEPAKFSPAQGREQEDIQSGEADCHARYASPASRSCGTYVRYIQLKVGEEWPVEKAFSIRAGYYDEYKAFYAFQITVCAHAGYGEAYPAIIGPEGRHMHEMIWSKGPNAVSEPDLDAREEIQKKLRRLVKSWLKEEDAKWLWIVINFLFGAHLKVFLKMGKEKPSRQVKFANSQPAN